METSLAFQFKMMFAFLSVIFLTNAAVFIMAGYLKTGDPFLVFKNFYNLSYNVGLK